MMYLMKKCASFITPIPIFITLEFIFITISISINTLPIKQIPWMHTLVYTFKPSNTLFYKLNTLNFSKKFSNVEGSVRLEELEYEYLTMQHSAKNFQKWKNSNFSKNFSKTECLDRSDIYKGKNKTFRHLYRPQ